MLPSRNRMTMLLQQRLGPNDVMKYLVATLSMRIETAAGAGVSSIEYHVPASILGMSNYDRMFVFQELIQLLRNNTYDVTELYAWTMQVAFPLRAHERLFCPERAPFS